MFLCRLLLISFLVIGIKTDSEEEDICLEKGYPTCNLNPILKDESEQNKKKYCYEVLETLKCLNKTMSKILCSNNNNQKHRFPKAISFREKTERQINFFNGIFLINCEKSNIMPIPKPLSQAADNPTSFKYSVDSSDSFTLVNETNKILEECKNNKCESKSLHITCGYPAANPNSNLNAYCNELKHYIKCAKCKTLNCDSEGSIISIRKHLTTQDSNYKQKCANYVASTTKSSLTSKNKIQPSTLNTIKTKPVYLTSGSTIKSTATKPKSTTKASTSAKTTTKPTTTTTTTSKATTTTSTTTTTTITTSTTTTTTTTTTTSSTTSTTTTTKTTTTTTTTVPTTTTIDISTTIPELISTTILITSTIPLSTSTNKLDSKLDDSMETSTSFEQTTGDNVDDSFEMNKNIKVEVQTESITEALETSTTNNIEITKILLKESATNLILTTTTTTTTSTSTTTIATTVITSELTSTITTTTSSPEALALLQLVQVDSIQTSQNESKIDWLLINFDHIDTKRNTLEALAEEKAFQIKIINRTDIFKGIRNGAVYLHSKTGFVLNLNEYANDLCLTSSLLYLNSTSNLSKINHLAKTDCVNGWSVLFWIKISSLIYFDKTILKIDNLNDYSFTNSVNKNSKFFILKLSSYDVKIQFLYKRKLWSITHNVAWKSEWSMLSLTWNEFEGLTLYVNDKKLVCQQVYEYYSSKENTNNSNKGDDIFTIDNNYQVSPQSESGKIYIGFNNNVQKQKKVFWTFREDVQTTHQNALLATSFSEAVLIDELYIKDYKMDSKEILSYYLKEYTIRNEYDTVEEAMYVMSTDYKQSEILPFKGAFVKKVKDNWFLNLNGEKQFVILPNIFDVCVQDADNLCHFGFTFNLWIKFNLNLNHLTVVDKNGFEQDLFYIGAQDFKNGLEAKLVIYSKNDKKFSYNYLMVVNYMTSGYVLTKSFKIFIDNTNQLSELNCITFQFSDSKNLKESLKMSWLDVNLIELESLTSIKISDPTGYLPIQLASYGVKSSVLASSNSVGLFGDPNKNSYFSIKNFEFKNYGQSGEESEYDFKSSNPTVYEFGSLDLNSFNVIGAPYLVDTIYGKSVLISKQDQKILIRDASNSCFGNMDLCKNGYTLKLWTCFTNYNLVKFKSTILSKNMSKRIYLLQNGKKDSRQGCAIYYDVNKSQMVTVVKTNNKWYKSEVNLKLKLYAWYAITVSWDQQDGLRLYINNKLLDHSNGYKYPPSFKSDDMDYAFTLGKSDHEFDEFPSTNDQPNSFENVETNLVEDREKIGKYLVKKSNTNAITSSNYYYEFIIHKIIQYDVRKYPDEIISKSIIFQEKRTNKNKTNTNWLLLAISTSLMSITIIVIAFLAAAVKRRTTNGFWSRENDIAKKKPSSSRLCQLFGYVEEDSYDSTTYSNLELKQCHVNKDLNCLLFNTHTTDRLISDEYSTSNSLFGTIDRLVVKDQNNLESSSASAASSSSSSTDSGKINARQSMYFPSSSSSSAPDSKINSASTSFIINQQDDSFDRGEIHF